MTSESYGLDDDFWVAGALPPKSVNPPVEARVERQSPNRPPESPLQASYREALEALFPKARTMYQKNQKDSKVIGHTITTILGSHRLVVKALDSDPKLWSGAWFQAIGSLPYHIMKVSRTRIRETQIDSEDFRSPKAFRFWLQYVASEILTLSRKQLYTALDSDNFMPDLRLACVAALNVYLIGATKKMLLQPGYSPVWTGSSTGDHIVFVRRKGMDLGTFTIYPRKDLNNGIEWSCECRVKPPGMPLLYFHKDLPDKVLTEQMVKHFATQMFISKCTNWLTEEALKRGPQGLLTSW